MRAQRDHALALVLRRQDVLLFIRLFSFLFPRPRACLTFHPGLALVLALVRSLGIRLTFSFPRTAGLALA